MKNNTRSQENKKVYQTKSCKYYNPLAKWDSYYRNSLEARSDKTAFSIVTMTSKEKEKTNKKNK